MTISHHEVCWLGLVEAGNKIKAREFSAVELTSAMLERIEALDGRLHSFALVTAELAMSQAAQADRAIAAGQPTGPLHGVPIALKDLCDTAGIVTAGGMWINRNRVPTHDATVVSRLREAGAVLLGKLQMTEGAFSAHHPKITVPVNPWGETLWPGVSSSGSGVATAAGLVFGSLGSDTLGSIRFPCAVNGLTGLKPTWGRVSRFGVLDLAPSMDHVGPMTRSAIDAAAMLAVIAGVDAADPTCTREPVPDYVNGLSGAASSMPPIRVGLDEALICGNAQDSVAEATLRAAQVMADLGATIVPVRLPDMMASAQDALQLAVAETAVTHESSFAAHRDDYGPVLSGLIESGRQVGAAELLKIGYRRDVFAGRMAALMADVDVIILPAMNVTAPTNESLARQTTDLQARYARLLFTAPIDMSRQPSLTLPGGFTPEQIPIGIQLVGRPFDEALLLRAGHCYQQATDWHLRHPASLNS